MSDAARGQGPLYSSIGSSLVDGVLGRPTAPDFVSPDMLPPEMVTQLQSEIREAMANDPAFLEPMLESMVEAMRDSMVEIGELSQEAADHWGQITASQTEMLDVAREATEDIVQLRDRPEERLRVQQVLNEANLPDVIQERALGFLDALGQFGQEIQQQAVQVEIERQRRIDDENLDEAADRAREIAGSIVKVLHGVEQEVGDAGAATPATAHQEAAKRAEVETEAAEAKKEQIAHNQAGAAKSGARGGDENPFTDVVDSSAVKAGDAPESDLPEGGAPADSRGGRATAREAAARSGAKGGDEDRGLNLPQPSSWEEGLRQGQDPEMWKDVATDYVGGQVDKWASGWSDRHRPDMIAGPDGSMVWKDAAAGAAYEAGMNRIGRVQGAITTYAEGGGVSGALAKAAPTVGKLAGGVGLAVGAATMATNAMEANRAANLPYTSTYGADGLGATGQRAQEWWFSNVGAAGTMSAQQASRLYQDVAQTGMIGDERSEALDFAMDSYRKWGMDVGQSMQFIEMASHNGIESLAEYEKGLTAVAETAKESGTSIAEAQKAYADAIAGLQGLTTGTAEAALATTISGVQTAQGHTAAAAVPWAELLQDTSFQQEIASEMDMPFDDVAAGLASGDQALATQAMDAGMQALFRRATMGRRGSRATDAMVAEAMEDGHLSRDEANAIGTALMQDQVFDQRTLNDLARRYRLSPTEAREIIAHMYAEDPIMEHQRLGMDVEERRLEAAPAVDDLTFDSTLGIKHNLMKTWGSRDDLLTELGINRAQEDRRWWKADSRLVDSDELDASVSNYFRSLGKRGAVRSENLESVYAHIGALAEEEGVDEANRWAERRLVAVGEDGEETEFGLDRITDHIGALERGEVYQVDEDGRRVSLQQQVGYDPTTLARERFQEQKVAVEVRVTGPGKDWIDVNAVGGSEIENNRATGTPAKPFSTRVPGVANDNGR